MSDTFVSHRDLTGIGLWDKTRNRRIPLSFDIEITARCNNNCRHCYINLPADDSESRDAELTVREIRKLAEEAVSLGSLWCLISGGEPLLREDFDEIYVSLKKAGLLVSVFTNATLITDDHIRLFKKFPPRDIEVTVYGVTEKNIRPGHPPTRPLSQFSPGLGKVSQQPYQSPIKNNGLTVKLSGTRCYRSVLQKADQRFLPVRPVLTFAIRSKSRQEQANCGRKAYS